MVIDHIALIVSKEKNITFYETFGFREIKRINRPYDTVVFMECDGIILEIFVSPEHPERVYVPESRGLRHIAFSVESLESMGVKNEDIQTDWFGRRIAFVNDLDGQHIELIEKRKD